MTRAFDSAYLDDARETLGGAFEYVTLDLGWDLTAFHALFVGSSLARSFERGEARVVSGMSGAELALRVLRERGRPLSSRPRAPRVRVSKGPEYWAGWALAYLQWETAARFEDLERCLPLSELLCLYAPLHEVSDERILHALRDRVGAGTQTPARLKVLRRARGITQAELAARSGVSLRSVQMYEQRNKDINRAQVAGIIAMARVIGCDPLDLLEPL